MSKLEEGAKPSPEAPYNVVSEAHLMAPVRVELWMLCGADTWPEAIADHFDRLF